MNTESYPSAFPSAFIEGEMGINILDYFAAHALPGVIQACAGDCDGESSVSRQAYFAECAYDIAAAMMNARLKYVTV